MTVHRFQKDLCLNRLKVAEFFSEGIATNRIPGPSQTPKPKPSVDPAEHGERMNAEQLENISYELRRLRLRPKLLLLLLLLAMSNR